MSALSLADLMAELPQQGQVTWLGVRPERRAEVVIAKSLELKSGSGITGDRYAGSSGKRDVTLIQQEHLAAIASMLGLESVDPSQLRRNIAVSGLNLLALKGRVFRLGSALLEYTGQCHPCSRMREILGPGGYNAVRGHGGITARILESGVVGIGDMLTVIPEQGSQRLSD